MTNQPTSLYRRLPSGPHRLDPEAVASNQRARMFGAMAHAVAERGYQATSVKRVIALAGVGRASFYEQFANRQECFLAAYDVFVYRGMKNINAAYRAGGDWQQRLRAAFAALAQEIVAEPAAARLAFVEVLGVGAPALGRVRRATAVFELMVRQSLEQAPEGHPVSPLVVRGIVGGSRQVINRRLREGRTAELPELAGDLLTWVLAYNSPAAAALDERCADAAAGDARNGRPVAKPVAKESGANGAGASEAGASEARSRLPADDERARLLAAVAEAIATDGWEHLSIADVSARAGVSHEAFHRHFKDTREASLAAFDAIGAQAMASTAGALLAAPDWPRAVRAGAHALMRFVARHPTFGRLMFVEIFTVGPDGVDRAERLLDGFAAFVEPGYELATRPVPAIVRETVAGASWAIISHHLADQRAEQLPALADHLAYIALAPFIGAQAAAAVLAEPFADAA